MSFATIMPTTEGSAQDVVAAQAAVEEVRRLLADVTPVEATLLEIVRTTLAPVRIWRHGRVQVAFEKGERLEPSPAPEGQWP